MKISPKQLEIIQHMANDWELARSGGFYPRVWLQQGGTGRGGKSIDLRYNTFQSLLDKSLIIKHVNSWPTSTYKLTQLAKELLSNK